MKHGSDWYKREPAAYLGGVQGMTAKEHAVYSVTLDLIYAHGGSVNNDPAWIAGWIKDMGGAAVRKAIQSLVERKKLIIAGDQITEKRAKTEAKTKENVRETARENGRKGGKKSGEIRASNNKNKDLEEPPASSEKQAEKIRGDKREVDLSTSSQEAEKYQEYLKAHPNPVASDAGFDLFSELVADGTDPDQIIAAAKAYAETVKGWSAEAKVQQSDNFLDPERGKWRQQVTPKAVPTSTPEERLTFWANAINGDGFIAPSSISPAMAAALVERELVTPDRMKQRGIAA